MNLLHETLVALNHIGKKQYDIKWIGSVNYGYFDWEHFVKIANVEYDNSYGAVEVAKDLVVVGDDWWLERHEYDGSEWWVFQKLPIKPQNKIEPNKVTGGYERSLRQLNE